MTYYNSAALYGGRNPYGAGFDGGYNIYEEDYEGGWAVNNFFGVTQDNQVRAMGADVIKNVGLTPRQQLLIEWWQTPDGGSVTLGAIQFAFGLVQLFDSLRARALTADAADREIIAARIKALRQRVFSEQPGVGGSKAQQQCYKLFTKAQKMIHRKVGINKLKARKWILDPNAPYTRGSWYKALPVPKVLTQKQKERWPAARASARAQLDKWKAFYESRRPPGTRKTRRSSTWSVPRSSRVAAFDDLPGEFKDFPAAPVVRPQPGPPPPEGEGQ